MISAIDLRKGLVIRIDGELYTVSGFNHVTPGKGRAHMQVSIKSLKQGNVTQKRYRPSDKVEDVFLDHRDMEYLYQEETTIVLWIRRTMSRFFSQRMSLEMRCRI